MQAVWTGSAAAPWRGIVVATALPLRGDGSIDFDRYAEHVAWLAANGCRGVVPNGSLGEYQTLSDAERAEVVRTAVAAAPEGFAVIPGVAAYGAGQARAWAEHAAEHGAQAVMCLPPNAYRAGADEVLLSSSDWAGHLQCEWGGMRAVFDSVGTTLPDSLSALRPKGRAQIRSVELRAWNRDIESRAWNRDAELRAWNRDAE